MRRLREHQLVTLQVERPPTSIECLVLAIDGDQATLHALDPHKLAAIPSAGKEAMLTFEYRSQLISLRGMGSPGGSPDELKFEVTDRVLVPQRRRHARVDVALPVIVSSLQPADGGAVVGGPIATQTRDLSADGLLVEELLPESDPDWRLDLSLPDGGPSISCDARFVRHVAGGTGMRYTRIAPEDRERLQRFVAATKREVLEKLRKPTSP